jgi:hypothetical protein
MRINAALTLFATLTIAGQGLAADATTLEAVLYKNPNCGCCEGHADHLRQSGFAVTVKTTDELTRMGSAPGIPEELEGCHVTMVGGYAVVGHVPADFIKRLLAEKPKISGISIPGMPTGVPGMEGPKEGPITVYQFSDDHKAVFGMVE